MAETVFEELHIRNLALIEEAWLEFGPGMTVLSGETGAGKTALLGGLKLLLGDRADSGAVRAGAKEALVEGRFCIEDSEVMARRRVGADGRSRCTLDNEMATVSALAQKLGPTVDLHGQHEHQALLSAATHCGYLDRWAGESILVARAGYQDARLDWSEAVRERDTLAERSLAASQDADYLKFVIAEIERVAPELGEDQSLQQKLQTLQHAEKLSDAASQAASLLRGEGGALDAVARARDALTRVSGIDSRLDTLDEVLVEIEALVDDAGVTARSYRDSVDDDPASLDRTLSRLADLNGLMKKYGPTLDAVLERLQASRESLAMAQDGEDTLSAAESRVAETQASLKSAAEALDAVRRQAAPGFTAALSRATADLAMQGAQFDVAFHVLPFGSWTEDGPSRVEFLFASTGSQPTRPLARIASGGEISRVMLALKSVLGGADTVSTLVFDEVDAGIGGATATAVGARLARLAQTHQVIVVTHLAQVAAFADSHLVVSKHSNDDAAVTKVAPVVGEERITEIARMLSGNDSEASRAHARELFDESRRAATAR